MTSSNGTIFRVTGHSCGEFTGPGEFTAQRPVTRSLDVFFDLRLNKPLSKQWWGWWFETLSSPLWRHCNDNHHSKLVELSPLLNYRQLQKRRDWPQVSERFQILDVNEIIICKLISYVCTFATKLLNTILLRLLSVFSWWCSWGAGGGGGGGQFGNQCNTSVQLIRATSQYLIQWWPTSTML